MSLLLNLSSVVAVGFNAYDLFDSDGSSQTDAKTFVNRLLAVEIDSSNIMVACFDKSNPDCDDPSVPSVDECYAANQEDFDDCVAYDSWLDTMGFTQDSDVASENMIVSSAISTCVDAIYYKNCDGLGSGNKYSVTQKHYYVFSKRKFDCKDGDVNSWWSYAARGYVSSYYDYTTQIDCPNYKKCSEDLDDDPVSTYDEEIPNPCLLADGSTINYVCDYGSQCWSGYCSGHRSDQKYICNSDGSDGYAIWQKNWDDTCGGTGYEGDWFFTGGGGGEGYYYCSDDPGSGYICDTDHENDPRTSPVEPPSPCRKNIGQSCSEPSECWNSEGGNICSSISQCTDKANGRSCGTGSDCTSGYCCNSVCSASVCEQVVDLAIVDIIPVQVIPNVDMVKGKSGYVRVIVHNSGLYNATALVTVAFEGNTLIPINSTKLIVNGSNQTYDFIFKPNISGNNKVIVANVTFVN